MEAEEPAMYKESVIKYGPILIRVCNSLLAAEPRLFREHLYRSSTEIFVKINPEVPEQFGFYALKRARPLARRAFITARPPRVLMRARKPWVRLRFNALG